MLIHGESMPTTSFEYWDKFWQTSPFNYSAKIKHMLANYLNEGRPSGIFGFLFSQSINLWPKSHARGSELDKVFFELFPTNQNMNPPPSVEYILAYIKREMYRVYPYNVISYDNDAPCLKEGDIRFEHAEWEQSADYELFSSDGSIIQGCISLPKHPNPDNAGWTNRLRSYEIVPLLLEALSKSGGAVCLKIDETDHLFTLFQVIKKGTGVDYFTLDYQDVLDRYNRLGDLKKVGNDWYKQEQLNLPLQNNETDHTLHGEQYYLKLASRNKGLDSLRLSIYNDGQLAITVSTARDEDFSRLEGAIGNAQLPPFHSSFVESKYSNLSSLSNKGPRKLTLCTSGSPSPDMTLIARFLQALEIFDEDATAVIQQIANVLNLEQNTQQVQVDVGQSIADAITAQQHRLAGSDERIWRLADDYLNDFNSPTPQKGLVLQQLCALLDAVVSSNPHYQDAQESLAKLLVQQYVKDKEKDRSLLKKAFQHAWSSLNQDLIDAIYDKLCGFSNKKITIVGVQPTIDKLMDISDCFASLNQKKIMDTQMNVASNRASFYHNPKAVSDNNRIEDEMESAVLYGQPKDTDFSV